jgi:Protein of unknown function (DUF1176)
MRVEERREIEMRFHIGLIQCVFGLGLAFSLTSPAFSQTAAAALPHIDLKLFDKKEVDLSDGCFVTLHQPDRDPAKDTYAYSFVERLHEAAFIRDQARIKIGAEAAWISRMAIGGKTNGYGVYDYQVYRLPTAGDFLLLDLKQGVLKDGVLEIPSGLMTIVMKGRNVFRADVKGQARCYGPQPALTANRPPSPAPAPASPAPQRQSMAPAAPPPQTLPPPVSDPDEEGLYRYKLRPDQFPNVIKQAVIKKSDCDPEFMSEGVTAYSTSEESALWEIPCMRHAFQSTFVFLKVYVPDPAADFRFMMFNVPKGKTKTAPGPELVDPEWDLKKKIVTSISSGRVDGDCGTYERHRLNDEGNFTLIEYREKTKCDGKPTKHKDFPLLFKAR